MKSLLKNTPYVANQSITIEEAKALVENGIADAISFGSLGIANPDLPLRIQHNYEINRNIDFSKSYSGGAAGYTDYPFYKPK
jgi:N-ethylmaleimide reductase